ncbi:LOW QUALITY PROTEIN: hypothetical protein V1478_004422 [Vespula squamosa]|uniref:Uncharacterized protein n=1 Tax=Vespula squamosa TaxID=30214 RepID=A0ABD2BG58_VESSQ
MLIRRTKVDLMHKSLASSAFANKILLVLFTIIRKTVLLNNSGYVRREQSSPIRTIQSSSGLRVLLIKDIGGIFLSNRKQIFYPRQTVSRGGEVRRNQSEKSEKLVSICCPVKLVTN